MSADNRIPYMTAEYFLRGGRDCLAVKRLQRELVEEDRKDSPFPSGWEERQREMQDWSYVNGQVVGAEVDSREIITR